MFQRNEKNRRRRFRVQLPPNLMLKATLNGIAYDVIEVAELSMVVTAQHVINEDGVCTGTIEFSDGRIQEISGQVGRLSHLGRVIYEIEGITAPDVVKEQRRLLRKFPTVRDPSSLLGGFKPEIFRPEID